MTLTLLIQSAFDQIGDHQGGGGGQCDAKDLKMRTWRGIPFERTKGAQEQDKKGARIMSAIRWPMLALDPVESMATAMAAYRQKQAQ
jgi:hypothetical protein